MSNGTTGGDQGGSGGTGGDQGGGSWPKMTEGHRKFFEARAYPTFSVEDAQKRFDNFTDANKKGFLADFAQSEFAQVGISAVSVVDSAVTIEPEGPPRVTSIQPFAGTSGTVLTIEGTNFGQPQGEKGKVEFNGREGRVLSWADKKITVEAPQLLPGAPGSHNLTIEVRIEVKQSNGWAKSPFSFKMS